MQYLTIYSWHFLPLGWGFNTHIFGYPTGKTSFLWNNLDLYVVCGWVWLHQNNYPQHCCWQQICLYLFRSVWIFLDLFGSFWICLDLFGSVVIHFDMFRIWGYVRIGCHLVKSVWLCLDLFGSIQICSDRFGFQWHVQIPKDLFGFLNWFWILDFCVVCGWVWLHQSNSPRHHHWQQCTGQQQEQKRH